MPKPDTSDLSSGLALRAFVFAAASFFVAGVVAAGALVSIAMQLGDSRPADFASPLVFLCISLVPIWIGVRASRRVRAQGTQGAFAGLAKLSPALCLVGAMVGAFLTYRIYDGRGTPTVSEEELLVFCESYDARAACQNALLECRIDEPHLDRDAQARVFACAARAMEAHEASR